MQEQFIDRLLNCVDCRGEFIFTAGEQLFFSDKQFKNDPKRCKPCKSRRSGLAAVANGTGPSPAGLSRTETRTMCSDCGIETTVPFKPTQGRPVLCRQCFQRKTVPARAPVLAGILAPAIAAQVALTAEAAALTEASLTAEGASLSADAAILAAASMSSASPQSSVATAADLASIAQELATAEPYPDTVAQLTARLIARTPADLLAPEPKAELIPAEAQA